jgi:outer membrane receptor protein involved in Fe transport
VRVKSLWTVWVALVLLACVPASARAENVQVAGRVVDAKTGRPVAGARIGLLAAPDVTLASSGEGGRFAFTVPAGSRILRVTAAGFRALVFELRAGETEGPLDLKLEPAALQVEEHLVVTPARQERPAADLPRAVSVIDRQWLEERAPRSTPEALADFAGVLLQKTNHGSGSPYVRGLVGNQVLVLVDGVRLNNSTFRYGPNQYLSTIDPASIERIEVVRGAGSALYGSDAIGGVINIVTRRARLSDGPVRVSGSLAGKAMTSEMERSARIEAEASSSRAAVRGGLSFRDFGDLVAGGDLGVESPSGYGEVSGDASALLRIGRTSLLSFSWQHLRQSDVPRFDQVTQRGYSRYAFDPQVRQLLTANWRLFPASRALARLEAGVSWSGTRERRERQVRGSHVLVVEQDTVRTWGFTLDAEMRPVGGWTITAGADAYHDGIGSWRRDENLPTGEALDKRGLYPDGASASSVAGFVAAAWSGERLHLDLGARYSRHAVTADDKVFGSISLSPAATVGSVAARYELAPGVELIGSAAQSFRAPNVDDVSTLGSFDYGIEVPSPDLSPETALGLEAGARGRAGSFAAAVTGFRTTLDNLIDRVQGSYLGLPTLEGQQVYRKVNVAHAIVKGVEVEAEYRFAASLRATGHLTYTHGQQASTGQPMRRIPPLNGLAALRWDGPSRLWLEGQARLAGAQRRLASGDIADHRIPPGGTPGWTVIDLYGGRRFGSRLSLHAAVVNIFDEAYRIHGSGIDGAGRSAWLAARWDF